MKDAALTACAGFLLAVLWMDLMFDSQVRSANDRPADGGPADGGPADGVLDEATLASIAGYYHRVTTTSRPRGALIAAVMTVLLALLGVQALRGTSPAWLLALSAVLAGGPILLALLRTVPNAVRLGTRRDDAVEQSRLARAIYRDHLVCLAGISTFLALWLIAVLR